jgi:uncharacterized protein YqhQ
MSSNFTYGGQAVIEGVMIRGQRFVSLAVRRPAGAVALHTRALSSLYTGPLRKIPFLRGIIVLVETLVLGVRALTFSANIALEEEQQELSSWSLAGIMTVSLGIGVGLFFLAPLLVVQFIDTQLPSAFLSHVVEGFIRIAIFAGYIVLIGFMSDIRRVFAYHGAEHMTVHAHEAGDPLTVAAIRKYPTAHPRCGTAFLLVVMVVAILVFSLVGRPSIWIQLSSRILLLPVIAGISYELLRLSGARAGNVLVQLIAYPSLALQALTTRQPEDQQIEVAICAMQAALSADEEPSDHASKSGWIEREIKTN